MKLFSKPLVIIILLTCIGGLFRFYNLNWGAPYYFHPDERNVAFSVTQLHFPDQLNPNFFAYGSLPIYIIYITGLIYNALFKSSMLQNAGNIGFDQAILISRFYSAFFSTLLTPLLYVIGKAIYSRTAGMLAAIFTCFSVGFIQFAHFGTFEMWITFFTTLLFYICLLLIKKFSFRLFTLASFITGVLIAIKVSNIVLILLPILPVILQKKKFSLHLLQTIGYGVFLLLVSVLTYFITNPFVIFSYQAFHGSMNYESGVALGTMPVFYTHEFYESIPVIFQFLYVYPFLLNPLMTVLFIVAAVFLFLQMLRTKNKYYFLLLSAYSVTFLSQAFLFVKWTRYMVPTLPFMYVSVAIGLALFVNHKHISRFWKSFSLSSIVAVCFIFAIAYTQTVFVGEDTRIAAKKWAEKNFRPNTYIATEIYDLGIVPFNEISSQITLCDFYSFETNFAPCNGISWDMQKEKSTYVILPSQRILKSRMTHKERYPNGYRFYNDLLHEKGDYRKIYETPCTILCQITYLGNPSFAFEQTANVFDRPTIYIFEKKNYVQ